MNEKKCRIFAITSVLSGGISLFYIGAALALCGIACGGIGLYFSRKLLIQHPKDHWASNDFNLSKIGLVFSLLAFITLCTRYIINMHA